MSAAANEPILHERREGWHRITLNRPEKLNSFNEAQHLALRAALDEAAADATCRAVLVTGAGRGFCAGQDLGDRDPARLDDSLDLGHTIETFYNPLIRQIRGLDMPVICAVNGVAAGAGANIALACDIVLAARSAKFIQAFSKIGLVPDSGGTWFLPRLIGEARAKALALTGEAISAEQAADWGLIWRVTDDETLMEEAEALAERLSRGPTFAYGLIKQAIQAASSNTLDEQLDLERDLQRQAGRSDDYREGVAAFLEKRAATFTGRAKR
ncbi:2-(1,2-epoxy-1,2-dihydrophenyl)acetyl-CoA isomerase PaaG [Nitratireductor sp. ZSWI3]|uniref:2-(1,2-epoxy-1,2-dihydrophenyl)acetyl-CoA isomerase PaaG n=1 Tax=Nitratireductor sp. ZSWI3 TaxID=2966359 RepID=UPI00214FCC6F|nr:2-(1,2-epoxy-1,2-dihydrophenyl)acetyl-CoA isomerase PaaG [Nitratireductor sp. ZSWI3]MCR4268578.1 2-(1,2-epoxy-1,2-dihydrophenyl)acetyl-CoA isomerase PaaG [Nitratireductor sp. ZSWI3]